MNERERLAELIRSAMIWGYDTPDEIAERLIDEGVICPPCKVGDIIYFVRKNDILKQRVEAIEINTERVMLVRFVCDYSCEGCPHFEPYANQAGDEGCWGEYGEGCVSFDETTIGTSAFLTREEAEAALAERIGHPHES